MTLRAWALPLQTFGSDQYETLDCADAGTSSSPGDCRTNYDDQPTGGMDGERENAMHVSEQHLLVHLRYERSELPLFENIRHQ